ncbi:MAG: hypothetical protein ACLP4V_33790 [Methylocella sp.]
MSIAKISIISGSVMLMASSTVLAGPMSVADTNVVAPPSQVERVQWWPGYGYGYGWGGAAVAGTALGLLSLGTLGAATSYPYYGYYGYPYGYYAGYYRPYYRHYAYWRPYRHYAYWRPYRHYAYYGGVYTGRSVYVCHRHHRWHRYY